jgi:hypothetical protein
MGRGVAIDLLNLWPIYSNVSGEAARRCGIALTIIDGIGETLE